MSEKERLLKYTDLHNYLSYDLVYRLEDSIYNYEIIIDVIKDSIEKINEKLSSDDNAFLTILFADPRSLLFTVRIELERILYGKFTKSFFEDNYDDFMEDERINPDIRRKLREIYNKIINNEKDPIIAKVRDAQAEVDVRSDLLIYWSRSRLGDVDNELIKIFLEHE